jgi:hypothetical protein
MKILHTLLHIKTHNADTSRNLKTHMTCCDEKKRGKLKKKARIQKLHKEEPQETWHARDAGKKN